MKPIIKKRLPNKFYLIEGIDGSGKDTFANLLSKELKKYFYYHPKYSLSIVGQPRSSCYKGTEALKFIENLKLVGSEKEIIEILKDNRVDFYNQFSSYKGVFICIRGWLTDIATLNIAFKNSKTYNLGQKKFNKLIIVDVDSSIASKRIDERGIPRTWREYPKYLKFFREFYLNFKSDLYQEKIIIANNALSDLRDMAEKLALEIYEETYE